MNRLLERRCHGFYWSSSAEVYVENRVRIMRNDMMLLKEARAINAMQCWAMRTETR
jgi:hypothetical protein